MERLVVASIDTRRLPLPNFRLERGVKRFDRSLGIGNYRRIRLVDLVDLHIGDVDVDELLAVEQVVAIVERGMLVERIADGEHNVCR